jgi:AcrR family transcriptional regulator
MPVRAGRHVGDANKSPKEILAYVAALDRALHQGANRFGLCDMPTKQSQPPKRKARADAQRNRERILEVAKEVFIRSGANTSLNDIAKEAGVGPGTLYRHFPTREELLQAVYRSELEKRSRGGTEVCSDDVSDRSVASLVAALRGCHRTKTTHRPCAQCAGRRSQEDVRSFLRSDA